jgi:hypothetical protein
VNNVSRRQPETQWRYLLNIDPDHLEVHDLDNEKTGENECQIDDIFRAKNARYLRVHNEDQMASWLKNNPIYDGCRYCLPRYHRK